MLLLGFMLVVLGDTAAPGELVAPAAFTGLLVYLIGVIIAQRRDETKQLKQERSQWAADRAALVASHEAAMAKALVDREKTIEYLRGRVESLDKDNETMLRRAVAAESEHRDCRESIRALAEQLRDLQRGQQ